MAEQTLCIRFSYFSVCNTEKLSWVLGQVSHIVISYQADVDMKSMTGYEVKTGGQKSLDRLFVHFSFILYFALQFMIAYRLILKMDTLSRKGKKLSRKQLIVYIARLESHSQLCSVLERNSLRPSPTLRTKYLFMSLLRCRNVLFLSLWYIPCYIQSRKKHYHECNNNVIH